MNPLERGRLRATGKTASMPDREEGLNRREFLLLSAMGSAMLLLDAPSLAATPKPRTYGAFQELPAGAVRPEGWLRVYLQKQADGLGAHLPDVSWPFTEPYWQGKEEGESWWPWEQNAYWIDGATRLALVLGDDALMAKVASRIDYTLAHADPDGYLGPQFFKEPKEDYHRWPQSILFRGLSATADAKASSAMRIAEAMRKHYLGDRATYGKPTRNVENIESILWACERTGDPALLALAEKAWADYLTVAADPEHGDLSTERVFANTSIDAHGVTYMETAKQPALLYVATGKEEYLRFAQAAQRRVFDHHMLVDGIPSTTEWYRTTTALDAHETCCIADHTWSWGYLMMATGDGIWGDRIERALFNAGPGAIKNDWRAVQYFSCPNQTIATMDSSHVSLTHPEYGPNFMAYQPNPGRHTACCGGNVHRLIPNYAIRMWMRHGEGLAATLYGPSTLTTTVGRHEEPITIAQRTGYPFDETIHLEIGLKHPVSFPLSFRIPAWCDAPRLEVNGKAMEMPPLKDGFVTLDRRFHPGDTVTLTLPMRVVATHWPDKGIALEHGPLVYALPIETEWTAVADPRYATAEFPAWNATPKSAWNYGLASDPSQAVFERHPVSDDPWSVPPTTLKVKARKIEGWDFQTNPKNPKQRYTPPLPSVRQAGEPETITLVPYGSTELRLTIFPQI